MLTQQNQLRLDCFFSERVAAVQRDFPKAVVQDCQNRQNPIRSFAAHASDVSHADGADAKWALTQIITQTSQN